MPKINDHSVINASKINVKENCENVHAFSRKLHFCENCYIWGKAIAGTAKIFPFSLGLFTHWPMMERCPQGMITIT